MFYADITISCNLCRRFYYWLKKIVMATRSGNYWKCFFVSFVNISIRTHAVNLALLLDLIYKFNFPYITQEYNVTTARFHLLLYWKIYKKMKWSTFILYLLCYNWILPQLTETHVYLFFVTEFAFKFFSEIVKIFSKVSMLLL